LYRPKEKKEAFRPKVVFEATLGVRGWIKSRLAKKKREG
jgi:hypothetical protein